MVPFVAGTYETELLCGRSSSGLVRVNMRWTDTAWAREATTCSVLVENDNGIVVTGSIWMLLGSEL